MFTNSPINLEENTTITRPWVSPITGISQPSKTYLRTWPTPTSARHKWKENICPHTHTSHNKESRGEPLKRKTTIKGWVDRRYYHCYYKSGTNNKSQDVFICLDFLSNKSFFSTLHTWSWHLRRLNAKLW